MRWVTQVKARFRPFTSAVSSAAKNDSRKIFLSGLLTAVVSFCSAISTAITADPAKIGVLTVVSALLGGVVAFCQAIIQAWRE